jgi:tRNA (guanine6-N2)-methyltransferase
MSARQSTRTQRGGVVELALQTLPGAGGFLLEDLRVRANDTALQVVTSFPDALVLAVAAYPDWLAGCRFFSSCSVVLGAMSDPLDIPMLLDELASFCAMRPLPADVGFRVADIGTSRWELRDAIARRFGWVNDPSDWEFNIRSLHGMVVADLGDQHMTRRLGAMLRDPASTTPIAAAMMVRLGELREGMRVLDPCCGTGTLGLLAVESCPSVRFIGTDIDRSALAKAAANLRGRGHPARLLRADAGRQPIAREVVDLVIGNLPFGKRVGSHGTNLELYPRLLTEISRVLRPDGVAVLMTEEKQLFAHSVQQAPGVRVTAEHVIETGGLHPSIYVVGPTRTRRLDARRRQQRAAATAAAPPEPPQ